MWRYPGMPAGFCDSPAYGKQEEDQMRYGQWTHGRWHPGYCSGLACYGHGGPKEKKGESVGTIHFAVDLDGTLIQYDGWKGEDHFGDPMEGAIDFVNAMLEKKHVVTVFTTRTAQDKVQQALIDRGFPELPVTNIKSPKFSVFIDDRAYRFNGPPQWAEMKDWDWSKKANPWNRDVPDA
jgi:hypothetical protein